MLTAAFLALCASPAAETVVLSRGAWVAGAPYQAVYDTYLDASGPDENHGGDMSLLGGGPRTILIRFGDLTRYIPANRRVLKAEIVFQRLGGERTELRSASRVRAGWGEGPYLSLSNTIRKQPSPPGGAAKASGAPRGSATWRQRRAGDGGIAWRELGAQGTSDGDRIADAKLDARGTEVAVTGLAPAVQAMVDRPTENFGFALTFTDAVEVGSSQSATGRPQLVLELADAPVETGADLSVTRIEPTETTPGSDTTFTAHVKNVGSSPATGFTATWVTEEREGASVEFTKPLNPGEETTLTVRRPYRPDKTDERTGTLELRIRPTGKDVNPRNDALAISTGAEFVDVALSPDVATAVGKAGVEDWVQANAAYFNDVVLDRSRFSFAPDGARARVAVRSVRVGTAGSEAVYVADLAHAERDVLRGFGYALGLPKYADCAVNRAENGVVKRGGEDLYPGLMGYGDTRYEGLVPGLTILPYEPAYNPLFDAFPMEPTGLLSATDVAILNGRVDGTLDATGVPALPKAMIVRAIDLNGRALPNAELSFFQSANGKIAEAVPTFTVTTSDSGSAILPVREGGPFGLLAKDGGNQVFLVRANANGVTEWGWLKAWQAMDSASRGSAAAAIMEVRFNLPSEPLDRSVNLAKERAISDSAKSLPAKLSPLVDGDPTTEAALPDGVGSWVEIDLGRDRSTGEIALLLKPGEFWRKFDVLIYATGQKPSDALPWAREVDLRWTEANRADQSADGRLSVPYRGQIRRFRYLRLVNRSGEAGHAAELTVTPVVVTPANP